MIKFKIQLTDPDCAPTKAHPSDSGWDLYAAKDYSFFPGERELIDCGFKMQLPEGYEAQIRPRSGLALKKGITVLNSPGTIDNHYRNSIMVILVNHRNEGRYETFKINKGDRIAQMVIKEIEPSEFEIVDSLEETDRGDGGFGSSDT